MNNYKQGIKLFKFIGRQFATKLNVKTDNVVLESIQKELYKPRKHPGIHNTKSVALPERIVNGIENVTEEYPTKTLLTNSALFVRHLKGRVPPMETEDIHELRQKTYDRLLSKVGDVTISNENDETQLKRRIRDKVDHIMKQKVYNWTPIDYNVYNSLLYLFGRCAPEYGVLVRIFAEINARDCHFRPRSVFDFGSGVGTVTWAANEYWKEHIFEYFNVDASPNMNDLAQTILQDGRGAKKLDLKGVYYRQFLPANNTSYDLVVSAYSLLELPSFETRMKTILRLWNKTENYLVIVENGTNAGFKVVNEARDFILQIQDVNNVGHVFSPCPHDEVCPRFLTDNTPCNFEASYLSLPIGSNKDIRKELYSYVVLKKGKRSADDLQWPRVVRDTLIRSKHTICRMCTSKGKLEEIIFSASKHGKETYHCARATKWGDRLPMQIQETTVE